MSELEPQALAEHEIAHELIGLTEEIEEIVRRNMVYGSGMPASQGGSVGVTSFLALTDSPDSYAGQSLKGVRVNAGETGLEFYTIDSSIYFLLAGRSGGQIAYGGTDSGDDLVLHSTSHATKGVIQIGSDFYIDEATNNVLIGTNSPLFNAKRYLQSTNTLTSNDYSYGDFVALNASPASDSLQTSVGLGFIVQTTGAANQLTVDGAYGQVIHGGTGVLTQAAGIFGLTTNDSSGTITAAYGANFSLLVKGTGNITTGIGLQIANPIYSSTGRITGTAIGNFIFDQGSSSTTLSIGLAILNQTSSTTAYALLCEGGIVTFNSAQSALSDFTILGDTDANLFFVDASADAIGIGSATITSGYKVEVGGKLLATNLKSGVYTPTRSAEANLDANVTMTQAQWSRTDNVVTVSGRFTADPTVTATTTSFEITLPVASNIGAAEDLSGVAFCGSIASMGAEITGVVANDTAKITWVSTDVASQTWSYIFSYEVI